MSNSEKTKILLPGWLRLFNVVSGFLYIIIATIIILNRTLAEQTLVLILAINVFLLGLVKIVTGVNKRIYSVFLMIINVIIGLAIIVSAIYIFASPAISLRILLYIIVGGLSLQGIYRMGYAIFNKDISVFATIINVFVGLAILITAGIVYFNQTFAVLTLILILAGAFILNGIGRIVSGIKGFVKVDKDDISKDS